jgi:hypothetical protein
MIARNVTMHYLVSIRTSSFFYAALSLALIIILSEYDSNNSNFAIDSQPVLHISHLIQVAAAVSTTTTSSNFYGSGGIIKIQLPGIIPSPNNSIPTLPTPPLPAPPISQPTLSPPPPAPIVHNTRAPPAPGGPTNLNRA